MTGLGVDTHPHAARSRRGPASFDTVPRLVFWETTKACPLACVHCRATAQLEPAPGELDTNEAMGLVDELAAAAQPRPVLILTGGDCLQRRDLPEIVGHARSAGVPVAISPSVSASLNPGALSTLRSYGVNVASLSLDGALAATHEAVRQVPGHFPATVKAVEMLVSEGFQVQVNTAVMAQNVRELADMAALLKRLGVGTWEVFFLVAVGRGETVAEITPPECEEVCHFLVDASRYGMVVRTVEAPFFRRVLDWRSRVPAGTDPADRFALGPLYRELQTRLVELLGEPSGPPLAPSSSTRDGKGIIFVAHDGSVYPAGFLPLSLGSVRERPVLEIYRESPLLKDIRAARFRGRCGRCEYSDGCGGSRARAYAATGDPLGDDPACPYVPGATTLGW